jgi:6-phosphogluconate dehydrogenase
MSNSVFGVIGLGVMGKSISLNLAEKGFPISVFNRKEDGEEDVVINFLQSEQVTGDLLGFTNLHEFIQSIQRPRKILLMIKAGTAVDHVINRLIPLLSKGDVIIDGGNSHYTDSNKRFEFLAEKGIHFVGSGISGGEEGARKGPSIMPGGNLESYQLIAPYLEKIAAKDELGNPCCAFIGPAGAGHFVKMVHNGIEYAEMQLLAELYTIMAETTSYEEIIQIFNQWNQGDLSSYLLDITVQILQKKEGDRYVLDSILDKAGNKGTGAWSSKAAFDLGTVNNMMSAAVFARYISSYKETRTKWSKNVHVETKISKALNIKELEQAYRFARIINHHQGFELIEAASQQYNWNLNLAGIARIWTNGCIIRSKFMNESIDILQKYSSILDQGETMNWLCSNERVLVELISYGIEKRVATPVFSSAYHYWISMTTEKLPANLLQAQRDFFGAHTYQRIDYPDGQAVHTIWS